MTLGGHHIAPYSGVDLVLGIVLSPPPLELSKDKIHLLGLIKKDPSRWVRIRSQKECPPASLSLCVVFLSRLLAYYGPSRQLPFCLWVVASTHHRRDRTLGAHLNPGNNQVNLALSIRQGFNAFFPSVAGTENFSSVPTEVGPNLFCLSWERYR